MSPQELVNQWLTKIESEVNSFNKSIPDVQQRVFERIQRLLKDLNVSGTTVRNNIENLRIINQIAGEVEKAVLQADYVDAVKTFAQSFQLVSELQNQYFKSVTATYKPTRVLNEIKKQAVGWTVASLTESGINQGLSSGIENILRTNITSGGKYFDLVEQMRNHITTNQTGLGSLERYTRQITTDALNQFSAQYSAAVTDDLGLEWFRYVGSNLATTRPFCKYLTKKEWIHKSELDTILIDNIDGVKICSKDIPCNKTTKLPQGMIPGTTAQNLKINRGGYNCGHQLIPVSENMVPKSLVMQMNAKLGKGPALTTTNHADDPAVRSKVSEFIDNNVAVVLNNHGMSETALINIAGGIPTDKISQSAFEARRVGTDVVATELEGPEMTIRRTIDFAKKSIHNDLMEIHLKGEGVGTNAFLNQVMEARKQGFTLLEVHAAGYLGSKYNGYYTWARLGYQMDPYNHAAFLQWAKQRKLSVKSVNELVSTKAGADLWKKEGFGWQGYFNLQDGSENMKLLEGLLKSKNIIVAL